MVNDTTDFVPYAQAALDQYLLSAPTIKFLGHSDNLTFRVEDADGGVYLLRLHKPVLSFWHGLRQVPDAIASELAWMEALAVEGGFTVQRPVRTLAGELSGAVEIGGEPVPCTLLDWLRGEHFSASEPDAELVARKLGVLAAHMHNFASTWTPPAGFLRPSYDEAHFRRVFGRFSRGVDHGIYSETIYQKLREIGQAILNEIQSVPITAEYWGMIHNDLHVGNFLVNNGQPFPIDFSFCGFGHYLFDVSGPLAGGLKPGLRPHFLDGYSELRPLLDSEIRVVEAYALAGRISYYAYQIDNPSEQAYLRRRIPQVIEHEGVRFLRGEPMLFIL